MDANELCDQLIGRDQRFFAALIDTYSRLLWAVACKYLSKSAGFSAEDVEECVSDVFFELWEHPERYDPQKGELKTYLCILAKNKAVSQFRKNVRNQAVYLEDHKQYGELPAEEPADYRQLYAAVSALPEPTREILVRRYFYGEKPAAIAEKMELPKKEVENRLYRGKQALSQSLSNLREVR